MAVSATPARARLAGVCGVDEQQIAGRNAFSVNIHRALRQQGDLVAGGHVDEIAGGERT